LPLLHWSITPIFLLPHLSYGFMEIFSELTSLIQI
jgi:hypothetical protein